MDEPPATLRHWYAVMCTSYNRRTRRWYSVRKLWKQFFIPQVVPSESSSLASNIWVDTHLSKCGDKIESEGKELPFKKKKKLPQRSSGLADDKW